MARALRIEYADAWYHVMNHGRRADKIFTDKNDYHAFLDLLQEAAELWKIRIAAFCLPIIRSVRQVREAYEKD